MHEHRRHATSPASGVFGYTLIKFLPAGALFTDRRFSLMQAFSAISSAASHAVATAIIFCIGSAQHRDIIALTRRRQRVDAGAARR